MLLPENLSSGSHENTYRAYKARGGALTPKDYYLLMEFWNRGCRKKELTSDKTNISQASSIKSCHCQAKHMAKTAGVDLTKEESLMYVFLRQRPPGEKIDNPGNGSKPSQLYDHGLMAEVLLITDLDKHKKFVAKWPNIFTPESEKESLISGKIHREGKKEKSCLPAIP